MKDELSGNNKTTGQCDFLPTTILQIFDCELFILNFSISLPISCELMSDYMVLQHSPFLPSHLSTGNTKQITKFITLAKLAL